MKLKINGVARGQYKQLCPRSWSKCNGDESELSYKIRRAVKLGTETYLYRNGCRIIRYHNLNFLIGDNEVMTIWRDYSTPPYDVSEELKVSYQDLKNAKHDIEKVLIKEPNKEDIHEKGFNKNIKINQKQTVKSLMNYGFTNYSEPTLYYVENLGHDITFNLSVDKETLEITDLCVLDEIWLQHYDYQQYLMSDPNFRFAKKIYYKVNDTLNKLQDDGIITGFEEGMYV